MLNNVYVLFSSPDISAKVVANAKLYILFELLYLLGIKRVQLLFVSVFPSTI